MKIFLIFFIIGCCGCQAVKYFGAVPLEDYQVFQTEIQKCSKDALENQGTIGEVTVSLAQENINEAKSAKDNSKLERSIETKVKAESATKTANKLAETKFTKTESPIFDLGDIMNVLMGILSTMFPVLGGYLLMLRKQLGTVKEKAKKYGSTNETFDVQNDKDLR